MSSTADKLLDGFQLLATSLVQKAGYDKTIQARIIQCVDPIVGKYKCHYQDANIYAFTNNTDITYNKDAYVYILVPGNDMTKEKTILGATDKLGINYIAQLEQENMYDVNGNNCVILEDQKYFLNTNNQNYTYKISKIKDLIDKQSLKEYIQQSTSILIAATFKTTIPEERQYGGHYGIRFNFKFKDNATGKDVVRTYVINEDTMVGNPYKLFYSTRQYQIFDIDGVNFEDIDSIEIYNNNFPNATGNENGFLRKGDIEISNLEIFGVTKIDKENLDGVYISFFTPQGTIFNDDSDDNEIRKITAQVRIKGKIASSAQKISYYWGIERTNVTASNSYYNKYLGRGWKCLNQKNVSKDKDGNKIEQWVPASNTYNVRKSDATTKDNKFKVAVLYNGNVVSKEIIIHNLGKCPVLTIQSDSGTEFYFDVGNPTLTCKIDGKEVLTKTETIKEKTVTYNYTYDWIYQDNKGIFYDLEEISQLASVIEDKKYKIKVNINKITNFGTFKCSVYRKKQNSDEDPFCLGTCSITLKNALKGESLYSLVINNGTKVFQYDENGVAPNSKTLENPLQLQALSFTLYDNLGRPIDNEIVKRQKITWQFPIKDSMLVDNNPSEKVGLKTTEYKYFYNESTLLYNIAQKYNIKKQHNQIKLTVNYKGMTLTTETNFTFTKQGDPGTNGTEYVVKIVPNTKMTNPPLYPMITEVKQTDSNKMNYILNYGYETEDNITLLNKKIGEQENPYRQLFKAQLWRNGILVWQGIEINNENDSMTQGSQDGTYRPSSIRWSMLKNQYGKTTDEKDSSIQQDSAIFSVYPEKGNFRYLGSTFENIKTTSINYKATPYASIVKCSIALQGKTYYGTLPVITAWVANKKHKVELKDYTGWHYAVYTSDGMMPQYDSSTPFKFIKKGGEGDPWEDNNWHDESDNYRFNLVKENPDNTKELPDFYEIGDYKYFNSTTKEFENRDSNLIQILTQSFYRNGLKKNQINARPYTNYNGISVNNAIVCKYIRLTDNKLLGIIRVPIHFLLNKYGLSHINEWDGNSIQLKEDGGFILSPQMGAGKKDNNNNFTGVLMGQVKQPRKQTSKIGLLGYNKGEQSFFLNSKNGSAIFGAGAGRIVIDPTKDEALLYSTGYWNDYNEDGDNVGLPKSYKDTNRKNGGMLINLSGAEIKFGTGKFSVNSSGHLHAAGGGDIAGWVIGQAGIYSNIDPGKGRITISAGTLKDNVVTGPGKIYSHNHDTLTTAKKGFYLSHDGLSIGTGVKITDDGVVYLGRGAVSGDPNKHWVINGAGAIKDKNNKTIVPNRSYIAFGAGKEPYWQQANTSDENKIPVIYIGTDGISFGRRFSISPLGTLNAYKGIIGGWTIGPNTLVGGNIILNSLGSISGGSDYKWSINRAGAATFNNLIASKSGLIGGWTIGSNYLMGGNLTLKSDGSIKGDNWQISSTGLARFDRIRGQVANNYTFIAGGATFNGGSASSGGSASFGGSANFNGYTALPSAYNKNGESMLTIGGQNVQVYIENLSVNKLKAASFKLGGYECTWRSVKVLSQIQLESYQGSKTKVITGISTTPAPGGGGSLVTSVYDDYVYDTNYKIASRTYKTIYCLCGVAEEQK